MKQTVVSLLLAMLMLGCSEDVVVFKLIKPSWSSHPSFTLTNKVKLNSFTSGQSLFLYGPSYFSILKNDQAVHYVTYFDYPFGKKLPINDNFFVSTNNSFIGFWPVAQPDFAAATVYFDMKDYDKDFYKVNFDLSAGKENMSINNANQCLVPYYSNNPDNKISLFLFDIGNLTAPYLYLKKGQRITINEPANVFLGNVSYIKPIDNFFIVSTASSTYKILSNGTVQQIFTYKIDEAFKWAGEIYAVSKTSLIAKSADGGVTWNQFAGTPALATGTYYILGDSLVLNYNDAIFSAKFKLPSYSLRELKNDGLEGNLVTSVSGLNDSIYVTTYSGVYYKSRKGFFESKAN